MLGPLSDCFRCWCCSAVQHITASAGGGRQGQSIRPVKKNSLGGGEGWTGRKRLQFKIVLRHYSEAQKPAWSLICSIILQFYVLKAYGNSLHDAMVIL